MEQIPSRRYLLPDILINTGTADAAGVCPAIISCAVPASVLFRNTA